MYILAYLLNVVNTNFSKLYGQRRSKSKKVKKIVRPFPPCYSDSAPAPAPGPGPGLAPAPGPGLAPAPGPGLGLFLNIALFLHSWFIHYSLHNYYYVVNTAYAGYVYKFLVSFSSIS